jgi:hypothetical protein
MARSDVVPSQPTGLDTITKLTLAVSLCLLIARFGTSDQIGFGDSEALYVVYGLFGQPSYLDHPGFIGWIAHVIADHNGVPSPVTVHRLTAVAATSIPWIAGLAARGGGASWRGAMFTILGLTILPELAIGLYAFTPDLPLAFFWCSAIGLALVALRESPKSNRALAATLGVGICVGLATISKVSGVLLGIAMIATWLSPENRPRLKTLAPWTALVAGVLCSSPFILHELRSGMPMLHHRLVNSQVGFGPTLRNVGALVGGQLLYVTPVLVFALVLIAIDLARQAGKSAATRMLFFCFVIPFASLAALTVLSRVAEPHWIAPSYVALAVYLGIRTDSLQLISKKVGIASLATALVGIALIFALVRFPLLPKLMGSRYEAKYDLTNDLYAWRDAANLIKDHVDETRGSGVSDVVVVGPHWIVCAQVQALLGSTVRVGCETDIGDDFDKFMPRSQWMNAKSIIYVTDDRFPGEPQSHLKDYTVQAVARLGIRRGGVVVRVVRVMRLGRMGSA